MILFLTCVFLLTGACQPRLSAAADSSVTITASSLNVREGPGLSFKVIGEVKNGETYSSKKVEEDWIQIKLANGRKGWVANWHVSSEQESSAEEVSATSGTGTVTTDGLRLRKGPGTEFQVVAVLSSGQTVDILETNENWTKIKAPDGEGWISKEYLAAAPDQEKKRANKSTKKSGTATVNSLNVREQPSLQSNVIKKLGEGETFLVQSEKDGWLEISISGQTGWVKSEYVATNSRSKAKKAGDAAPDLNGVTAAVTTDNLQVRAQGSFAGEVIGSVSKGKEYPVLEEKNNWTKIEYEPGLSGWVASWYLSKSARKSSTGAKQEVKNSTVAILHDGTNIRNKPGVDHSVISRANQGESFQVISMKNDWYEIELSNGSTGFVAGWLVSVNGPAPKIEKPGGEKHIKGKTIIIDPGHGGRDFGATGAAGTNEKELTLKTAKLLYDKLKAAGANVILTRSNDTYKSLKARVKLAHSSGADAFISIHYDSIEDNSVRGMTSFYYHDYQKTLAESIHAAAAGQAKIKDRGVRHGDYLVLRENKQTAVLLELGYLSNPSEETLITSGTYQESIASGVFDGLTRYFKK
ncbi:N-acetylmuramoyl-L-alanine amidase [Bacillus sp. V3-13]|uniref:SH3 domain-containing protein n=1 Tax=Bacillus sp. V3-13 TaxID=2053728 RepID=UPI000C77165A|nr:SH3 domain-containing protein [Bacillus sp. V3-13]PLR78035.1 N-acetylmuramoyl-L-alanine amidase [Bacillus sp. V3-13]